MPYLLVLGFLLLPAYLPAHEIIPGRALPPLNRGTGAGAWNSVPKETNFKAWKHYLSQVLRRPGVAEKLGSHAVDHLLHYFSGGGAERSVDVPALWKESKSAREDHARWRKSLERFAADLPEGRHPFTSPQAVGVVISAEESPDWYRALGKYHAWVDGEVRVEKDSRQARYRYHVWDPYDWEPGPVVFLSPEDFPFLTIEITQNFMGEFHRQGLAKEFLIHGAHEMLWTATN